MKMKSEGAEYTDVQWSLGRSLGWFKLRQGLESGILRWGQDHGGGSLVLGEPKDSELDPIPHLPLIPSLSPPGHSPARRALVFFTQLPLWYLSC